MPPLSKEKIAEKAQAIRTKHMEKSAGQPRNFLVYGHEGTGKTRLVITCPKPIVIASFDPGGTTTRDLQPLIKSGDVLVEDFSGDNRKEAKKFREWELSFGSHVRDGFFEHVGTYVIDSITRWADAMMNDIVKRNGFKNDGIPEQRYYLLQQNTAVDYIGILCDQPCHTLCTGHIGLNKDEVEGRMYTGLLLSGKLADKVPLCFDEKYISRTRNSAAGVQYQLQTKNDGQYRAETRMGGGVFEMMEEPDIKALMRKADVDDSDKPSFF